MYPPTPGIFKVRLSGYATHKLFFWQGCEVLFWLFQGSEVIFRLFQGMKAFSALIGLKHLEKAKIRLHNIVKDFR